MLPDGQLLFWIATGLYGLSLASTFLASRRPKALLLFLLPALLVNAVALYLRFWTAWPMLPMYAGPLALPLFMGGAVAAGRWSLASGNRVRRSTLTVIVVIALAGVLFPKDYYIPFIKSQTIWAHLFFWFGVAGRGCFFMAAAWALAGLTRRRGDTESGRVGEGENRSRGEANLSPSPPPPLSMSPRHRLSPFSRSMQWVIWGFALWTLSMFTGEMWSYLGWGTPVVWDDPAITTTMATWFFYICLLHLHLTGTWTIRGRGVYTAAGALVVLALNCGPELGPFRWPL
jgi:hypothetical protein